MRRCTRAASFPGGGPFSHTAPIDADAATSLVAVFNAGFLMANANGGYYTDGRTEIPLRNGAASLVIYNDGTATVGAWGQDVSMTPNVASVRQNLDLLVNNGQPVPGLDASDTSRWGFTLGNQVYVWRSGVGVTADGALVYVGGPSLNITSLANVLAAAGCVRAMELDINTDWVNMAAFNPAAGQPAGAEQRRQPLVDDERGDQPVLPVLLGAGLHHHVLGLRGRAVTAGRDHHHHAAPPGPGVGTVQGDRAPRKRPPGAERSAGRGCACRTPGAPGGRDRAAPAVRGWVNQLLAPEVVVFGALTQRATPASARRPTLSPVPSVASDVLWNLVDELIVAVSDVPSGESTVIDTMVSPLASEPVAYCCAQLGHGNGRARLHLRHHVYPSIRIHRHLVRHESELVLPHHRLSVRGKFCHARRSPKCSG